MHAIASLTWLLMVAVCTTSLTGEELPAETDTMMVYAAVGLQPGIPDFRPLRSMMPQETYSARIPYDREGCSVHFTWGVEGQSNPFYLYLTYPGNTTTVQGFTLHPGTDGALEGIVEFNAETGTEVRIPIMFRLLPEYHTLLYHWVGSPASAVPGTPTEKSEPLRLGAPIPEMAFLSLDGDTLNTGQFRSTVTVLNWWATNCVPCIAEIPDLNELVAKYASPGKAQFIAVAMDQAESVHRLLQRHPFQYQQTVSPSENAVIFGVSFPRHVVVGPDGVVVFDRRGAGPTTSSDIAKAIESLIPDAE